MHPTFLGDRIPSNQVLALQMNILDANEQKEIIICEHNRAHRAAQENVKQVLQDYYFPNMSKIAKTKWL